MSLARFIIPLILINVSCLNSFKAKHNEYLQHSDLGPLHQHNIIDNLVGSSLFRHSNNNNNQNELNIGKPDVSNDNPIIYITDFSGADPSGMNDSTKAFENAIATALKRGASNTYLADNITDCGGATIDLGGGDYLISKPLTIPPMYGNLRIIDGTIRASTTFKPVTSYLLNIGDINYNCSNFQKSCNENIAIENLMLDCKHIAYGGLHVIDSMGTIIGPQIFILGFTDAGITINGGHEAMIFESWLGEYLYSDPDEHKTATAIQIFGYDNYITNTIIFCGKIGVHLTGGANVINGVHVWGLASYSEYNSSGILVETDGVRIVNCYMDYNDIVLNSPIDDIEIHDTFFLGGGTLMLKATSPKSEILSLNFRDSQYKIGNEKIHNVSTITLDESNGNKFTKVYNFVVDGIMNKNGVYDYKSPNYQTSLYIKNSTKWIFDFKDVLLFDNIGINQVEYNFVFMNENAANQFIQHSAMIDKENNQTVVIQTNKPCDATVYIKVDQSIWDPTKEQ